MHRYLIIYFISLFNLSIGQDVKLPFIIKGHLKGSGNSKVLLGNKELTIPKDEEIFYYDSCYSINDSFEFKGYFNEYKIYSIEIPDNYFGWRYFVIDSSTIYIDGSVDSIHLAKVTGSYQHEKFIKYRLNIYKPKSIKLNKVIVKSHNLKLQNSKKLKYQRLIKKSLKIQNAIYIDKLKYINDNKKAFASLFLLSELLEQNYNLETIRKYFISLSDELKNNSLAKTIRYKLDSTLKLNDTIPEMNLCDINGNVNSLEIKSKFTLLNFWASWCKPCIAEIPELKELYQEYKRDEFDIIGISIDSGKKNWNASILKYSLPWTQFIETKLKSSQIDIYFNVSSIPKLVLVDNYGKIVIYGATMEELSNYLKNNIK